MIAILELAMRRLGEADDNLGREAAQLTDGSNEQSAEALIAIATAHLMAARQILSLVMTPAGAAQVFSQHADGLAAKGPAP